MHRAWTAPKKNFIPNFFKITISLPSASWQNFENDWHASRFSGSRECQAVMHLFSRWAMNWTACVEQRLFQASMTGRTEGMLGDGKASCIPSWSVHWSNLSSLLPERIAECPGRPARLSAIKPGNGVCPSRIYEILLCVPLSSIGRSGNGHPPLPVSSFWALAFALLLRARKAFHSPGVPVPRVALQDIFSTTAPTAALTRRAWMLEPTPLSLSPVSPWGEPITSP
jgi:hypothetical protein